MITLSRLLLTLLLSVASASAATYYVDFEGGNDQADGQSPQSAWKRSPGDKKATGTPKGLELQPGDKVIFKGGVQYFGEVKVEVSGSEGAPIILDGNSDGKFGTGPAVLDGAKMITGWQRVTSADQVDGNPKWKEIMYVDLDADLTSNFNQNSFVLHRDKKTDKQAPWQRIFLIDGERRVLPIAQLPKPSDSFYPDLPADFYDVPLRISDNYPHKIYYEQGSKGNGSLPLIAITNGGSAPVVEPLNGGEISLDLDKPTSIAEIGITLYRPATTNGPEEIVFSADGNEVYTAKLDTKAEAMQRFKLPRTVKASKITYKLQTSDPKAPKWTKLQGIAAFTPEGENIVEQDVSSVIVDEKGLTQSDPNWFDGMFVGVRGGNNHVYFGQIKHYDPAAHQLQVPHFDHKIYDNTQYAFYNSPKLIELPGEWCLEQLDGGRTRVFFLPEQLVGGQPVNIGYPELRTALELAAGVSHIEVRGFLIQRFAGGKGGVSIDGNGNNRATHIRIADCEVRFMSVNSGINLHYTEDVTVENCYIHHCPGWTVGIYVDRVNNYQLLGNRVYKNSGSGIRHYESKQGVLKNNAVLNHYGMHSSGLNFYEGCADILFEGNYVQNVIAINRSAQNLTFRNNVIDSEDKNAVSIAMWGSGKVGGRFMKNIVFENNTLVNLDENMSWGSSIFVQSGASAPEGLVVRNNVLDYLRPPVPGIIEGNIFMRKPDAKVEGSGSKVVEDADKLFVDPANGDYRRKPGGPMMNAGSNVPLPPAEWKK